MHAPAKPVLTKVVLNAFLSGTFLLFLFGVLIAGLLPHGTGIESNEQRLPAPWPALTWNADSLARFPAGFDAYFTDRLGFRRQFLALDQRLMIDLFRKSPVPLVLLGEHGWLYFTDEQSQDDYRGAIRLSPNELENVRRLIEGRRDHLASMGIRYACVFAPDKQSIYPEYIPSRITRLSQSTRLDQIQAYLQTRSDFRCLDLRPVLLDAKRSALVYHRTDSHWNDAGAFAAYQAIMDQVYATGCPQEPRLDLASLDKRTYTAPGRDLAVMIGMEKEMPEQVTEYRPRTPRTQPIDAGKWVDHPTWFHFVAEATASDTRHLRAIIFRDSFCTALMPYLSESFGQVLYMDKDTDRDQREQIIQRFHPDIVIDERVERSTWAMYQPNL